MRILEINTVFRRGSTGMIVEKLKERAEAAGHTVLVAHRYSDKDEDDGLVSVSSWLDCHIHNRLHRITGLGGFFSRIRTRRFLRRVRAYAPDLIHLHNLHGSYLHLPSLFRYLKKSGTAVVWTLHDCWAMTGLCPYFDMLGCDKWKTGCHECPFVRQSKELRFDFTKYTHRQKKKILTGLPRLTLTAPSRWLAEASRSSSYLSAYPVRVIYNGIDLSVFHPTESDFRERYGLVNKTVLLGVAFDFGRRKGLDVFIELSRRLDDSFRIVLVGVDDSTRGSLPDRILALGRTDTPAELAAIYTAADLFVNPTREEALGLVNLEALACGTPGVTFAAGGSPECYDRSSGSVVPIDDLDALEGEIRRITKNRPYTAEACIARARAFDADQRYGEYLALYEELYRG